MALIQCRRHSPTIGWSCDADSARYSLLRIGRSGQGGFQTPLLEPDPAAGPDLEEDHGRSVPNQASVSALLFIYLRLVRIDSENKPFGSFDVSGCGRLLTCCNQSSPCSDKSDLSAQTLREENQYEEDSTRLLARLSCCH